MSEVKQNRKLYVVAIINLLVFSSTFLLMPISNYVPYEHSVVIDVIVGILFWVTGLTGYGLLLFLRRRAEKENRRKNLFFANRNTAIMDTLFIAALIGGVLVMVFDLTTSYLSYLVIFTMVLSVNGHLIFSREYIRKGK